MAYTVEQVGDVCVLNLRGEVWGGWDSVDIKEMVGRLLDEGRRKFVVDLSETDYVNSVGVGILVAMLVTSKLGKARLSLCSVSTRSRRAFDVTGVVQLFELFKDRADALRILGADEGPAEGPAEGADPTLQAFPYIG